MFSDPPPAKPEPPPPTVDKATLDQEARDLKRKRRGVAANVLAGNTGPAPASSVATATLLGS